jgi:hypothetical protein
VPEPKFRLTLIAADDRRGQFNAANVAQVLDRLMRLDVVQCLELSPSYGATLSGLSR